MNRLAALLLLLLFLCPVAQAAPVAMETLDDLPELTEEGFLPEGEDPRYIRNHQAGYWYYVDDTTRVEINRVQTSKPLSTYYIADVYCASGTGLYTETWNKDRPGRTNGLPQEMASAVQAVLAMSGDFYSYRVANDRYPGNIVRDGKVLYHKSYSKLVDAIPNLATMGFYPSGRAEVNEAWEKSAKDYVNQGVTTVVAFGPLLLRDGEIQDVDKDEYNHEEPRLCLGIVEPGHYGVLMVEGRKPHANGATLVTCAEILSDFGCWDAINLDGGNTAALLFMGESVQLSPNGGVDHNDRAIPDILCFGKY